MKKAEEYYDTTAPVINEISYLDFEASCMERGIYISDKIRAEAEQFLKDNA